MYALIYIVILLNVKDILTGFFPLDLTGDEAIKLGVRLIRCGEQAKKMDKSVEEYFERNTIKKEN